MQQKEKQREQQTNELKELETKTREEKQAVSELKADKKTELDKIDKAMEKSQDQVSEYTKKSAGSGKSGGSTASEKTG